jgi:uncharacterized membrane protein
VLVAVVAGTGFGLLFVCLDRTSESSGLWPLLLAQLTSLLILATVCVARRVRVTSRRFDAGLMVLAGCLAVTANVAYLAATRQGLLSLVAVITSMYPASTVVLATVLDHERMSNSQAVGLGLAVGALGMVGAGS